MRPDFDELEFVIGGFAAASAEPEIVTPEILTTELDYTSDVQTAGNSPAILGAVFSLPFGVFSVGAATVPRTAKYTLIRRAYEKIKSYIAGEARPISEEEFREALEYCGLIDSLKQVLQKHAQQHGMTEPELFYKILTAIRENPAYKYISDANKINLANRLMPKLS